MVSQKSLIVDVRLGSEYASDMNERSCTCYKHSWEKSFVAQSCISLYAINAILLAKKSEGDNTIKTTYDTDLR